MQIKYLGVDAGATKTRAALYRENGTIISRSTQGHGNIIVNEIEAMENISLAISSCLKDININDKIHALVGIAGIQIANKSSKVKDFNSETNLSISGSVLVKNKKVLEEMLRYLPYLHFIGGVADVTKAAYYYWQEKRC